MNLGTPILRGRDVLRDVTIEMHARRTRTVLMMIAVALSSGALISALSISNTAARQVDADLAASTLNLISVAVVPVESDDTAGPNSSTDDRPREAFPADAEQRVEALEMIAGVGRRLDATGTIDVAVTRGGTPTPIAIKGVTVTGLTSGYLLANETTATTPATSLLDSDLPVAFLGARAAKLLDIPIVADPTGFSVNIKGIKCSVGGFLKGGSTDLSDVVAVPYDQALEIVGNDDKTRMLIRTEPGAGSAIASVVRLALRPDAPERLTSSQVVSFNDLRTGVSTQLDRLAAWVGSLLLMLTILLIANAMVVSVTARTSEIGLRRAMGASRGSVSALFLTEGALSGALGGLGGSAIAAVAVIAVAIASHWSPVFTPTWIALGPTVGVVAGLVSSLYPALRAASIQPAQAVRSD